MLYFSRGSFGSSFDVAVCPDAVATDASETSKIEIRLADIVENFMDVKWLNCWSGQAHAIPDFRFVIPNRRAGALPLLQNSNPVENYLRLIDEEILT